MAPTDIVAPAACVQFALSSDVALGLYRGADFRLADGHCTDCPTIRQALWYFTQETIAVPNAGVPVATFATGVRTTDDLAAWLAARPEEATAEHPPLVWIAAPQVIAGARLSADAAMLHRGDAAWRFDLVPKIPANRSYFDASSAAFLRDRSLKVRGRVANGAFVARTIWPEDFRLDRAPPAASLAPTLPAAEGLRALVRAEPAGGARSPFAATTLWQRHAGADAAPPGRAIIGIMVNGAQGDDDEAHGGHFALVTGRTRDDGAIGDWLANNFYSLDVESEKGILAAPAPLDNYLADLNSGQAWYRPSCLLVAVLSSERAPALLQAALHRVYSQFWRHQLVYRHAAMNCASISVDTLRALGWPLPARGAAGALVAALGFPLIAAKERSFAKARMAADYLTEDQTRLMPAAAFEEAGASLLALAAGATPARAGTLARWLATDLDALVFVRFPQLPSSRAFGDAPAVTPWEYHARIPAEPGMAQIIPLPPRPFPPELRDPDLLPAPRAASDAIATAWGVLSIVGVPWLLWRWWQRRRARRHAR
jgi:hypothetical protein